jgi:hypothetical protein
MIRHDLHFAQFSMWEMVRDRAPAFIHDTTHIRKFNMCIGPGTNDASEYLFAPIGTHSHEIRPLHVIVAGQADVFSVLQRHMDATIVTFNKTAAWGNPLGTTITVA